MQPKGTARRFYLDWLRVIAIASIFFFHSTRFFTAEDWHVHNAISYPAIDAVAQLPVLWAMPLIFLVSGAATFFSLRPGRVGRFVKNRFLRLAVPLLVAIPTHVALQVYLERLTHGQFQGSFFQFMAHYFDGLYFFGGDLAWFGMHLWYLEILFLLSLILLPLLLGLQIAMRGRLLQAVGRGLALPGAIYLLAVPCYAIEKSQGSDSFLNLGGWSLPSYVVFFLAGYLIASSDRLEERIRRGRWPSLIAGVAFFVLWELQGSAGWEFVDYLVSPRILAAWCLLLGCVGLAIEHLKAPRPLLAYASEAVLPFYILHQTVLLCIGFYVVRWPIPDLVKWAIITPVSLAIILVLYEFLVRRFNGLRFLFGMRVVARRAAQPQTLAPVEQQGRASLSQF